MEILTPLHRNLRFASYKHMTGLLLYKLLTSHIGREQYNSYIILEDLLMHIL